jgi:hypothetical protein
MQWKWFGARIAGIGRPANTLAGLGLTDIVVRRRENEML